MTQFLVPVGWICEADQCTLQPAAPTNGVISALTFTSALNLAAGSTNSFELAGTNAYGQIKLATGSTCVLTNGAVLSLHNFQNQYQETMGDIFTLYNVASGASADFGQFIFADPFLGDTLLTNGAVFSWSGFVSTNSSRFLILYGDTSGALGDGGSGSGSDITLTVIPEPSSLLIAVLPCLWILAWRRIRR